MAWVDVAIAGAGLASSVINSQSAKANKAQPLNVSKAISDAQTQATNDLQNSINLENQFLPGQAANRTQANALTSSVATGNTPAQQAQLALLQQAGSPITNPGASLNNPLTSASNASILQSLNQGGNLDPATQAQVMQGALAGAGTAGISGSGAGRGLVARDLGLTSLQLLQQRQQTASAAGNAYGALGLQSQSLQLQDYLSRLSGVSGAVGQNQNYALGLGNLMNNTALPNSGLSGSQVASLDVGNTNIINGANQQTAANNAATTNSIAGSLGGLGGLAGLFGSSSGSTGSMSSLFSSGAGGAGDGVAETALAAGAG